MEKQRIAFWYFLFRPVARGGVGGVVRPPPQLPIPKILFHPLAILFHPLAILFHLSAILFHPLAILFHLSAILFHPLAILFHPSAILFHPLAILFHPWNMWMTSHGQCPRGGVLVNVQEWGRFSNWWRHADNVQGGGGVRLVFHPSKFRPPPHLAGWLRACFCCHIEVKTRKTQTELILQMILDVIQNNWDSGSDIRIWMTFSIINRDPRFSLL